MFNNQHSRFATFEVVSSLPPEIIDEFWHIIDEDLKGMISLDKMLKFKLEDRNGKLTIRFQANDDTLEIAFDFDYQFDPSYPKIVYALDDGTNQLILLPDELQ